MNVQGGRRRRALLARWGGVCLLCLAVQAPGCGASRRPVVQLDPVVERPECAVLLITVDGLAAGRFEELLAAGDLPNIRTWLIDRGVRVRRAVASQPTITYASLATILTGRYAAAHGILGNSWFDRWALVYRDYTTMATYRLVDGDLLTQDLFELAAPRRSVSIQCANRRGATRAIDNWASSGIRWFFGFINDVDRLVPLRMELIAQLANRWGEWPALVHAYLPAVDEIGHRYGPDSPEYRDAAINADGQVGRLMRALNDAGMLDRTYVVLTSDHGHVPSRPDHCFNVADYLRRQGLRVEDEPSGIESFEARRRHYDRVDAVVVNGGDRRSVIHLRGPGGWQERPDFAAVAGLIDPACHALAPPGVQGPSGGGAGGGTGSVWATPAVGLALAPWRDPGTGRQCVDAYSRAGHSRLARRCVEGQIEYGYEVVTTDALAGALPTGWYDAETWLARTADGAYPDLVVSMVELFESPRAGDVMLVAADDWDFRPGNRGGHGGAAAADVLIPLVFAGPGLPKGAVIDHARLVDVAPTILGLLSGDGVAVEATRFDGVDRSPALRSAKCHRGDTE